jgi:photosystem II stability/assembly factor-like uncharacterized protein
MKKLLLYFSVLVLLAGGCSKDMPDQPIDNQRPKTFLWLFPDSSLAEGHSKQHLHWWGEDSDGMVVGYLFASDSMGKLLTPSGQLPEPDTIAWRWKLANDTLMPFPLLFKRETFQVVVRAVDNTFQAPLPDHALIRYFPFPYWDKNENGSFDSTDQRLPLPDQALVRFFPFPYWDKNENGSFDGVDERLPFITEAVDPVGARLGFPILNQPPSIVFAPDPNDPSVTMQQPETTFTAATFAWVGTDPDGDQTISTYEMALNDTTDPTRLYVVSGNTKMVSLVVPRGRSDGAVGEVEADVYSGAFLNRRKLAAPIRGLKLDALNKFYIRARDVAGDTSSFIEMPNSRAVPAKRWFVKNPNGKLLIVNDFITNASGNRDSVISFYRSVFPNLGTGQFSHFEVLDIARLTAQQSLTAQQKRDGRFGAMVPPFIDPAFLFTLQLFDVVFWYTDQIPSLPVAQFPLFQYVRDPSHKGKVIFSTMFESSMDPRGALKDFAPIDSVSSADLLTQTPNGPLLPRLGDTRIQQGFYVIPDSSELSNVYPNLRFKVDPNPTFSFSLYMRPIYKRADARYIYFMQDDSRIPRRYTYVPTLAELRSVCAVNSQSWACGAGGAILHTSDVGQSWSAQKSGIDNTLHSVQFLNANNGWSVGEEGAIVKTIDGGSTWSNRSVITFEDLISVHFTSTTTGIAVGTNGIVIHTMNGGTTWDSPDSRTNVTLRSVDFFDENVGVAVGDGGTIIKTSDGGSTWGSPKHITTRVLNSVKCVNASVAWAAGERGVNLKTTDAGETWNVQTALGGDLRSIYFIDINNGWISGTGGLLYRTVDGGSTWISQPTGISQPLGNGQNLNSVAFMSPTQGWCAGTGGIIIYTNNGGTDWTTQPKGKINIGVVDGIGNDGKRSFVFLGLPLHLLNGDKKPYDNDGPVNQFLEYVLFHEFGE